MNELGLNFNKILIELLTVLYLKSDVFIARIK